MAWIELHQAVWTHRKTFELASLLELDETYAAAHMIRLWTWALDNAPDGDLSGLSDRAIAYGAGWRGDVEAFIGALIDAGWLDQDRTIHDWEEYAGRLVERRRQDAERKRASRGRPADVQGTSNGTATGIRRTGPDLTGPDLTGPDPSTPTPPPQAEEGGAAGAAEKKRRRGRRNGVAHDEPEPVAELDLTPVDSKDRETLNQALAALRAEHDTPAWRSNTDQLGRLEPLGRAPDGGLHLRAPPGSGLQRFRGQVARALLDAGDQAAGRVTIIEVRPGGSEG